MLVRPIQREWEMWKWLMIASLAAILALAIAVAVGAGEAPLARRPPGRLPAQIERWAAPMPREDATKVTEPGDDETGCMIWGILELHRVGEHQAAIRAWNEMKFPQETAIWQWIATAQALIATDRIDEAEQLLGRATEWQPHNAVAFYFRGVLRMQQAHLARDWQELWDFPRARLATFGPRSIVPNTKSMYELAAIADFERAIELASTLDLDQVLVANDQFLGEAATEPAVRDLLAALGAENFAGKAHNVLGHLYLEHGALELAEQHLDHAVQSGVEVAYGYRDLASKYLASGRHGDSARACLKATMSSDNKLQTLWDCFRRLSEE